ncbi:DNA polymerase Y family protein [Sellimonas sp.]|uniref:DNA polymerase Y family protein n=1 Tax=Sellimonas sp. TaxID=2021466 RepID=UPI00257E7DB3|nr:DNA polymerase IV [Sellimonas sp.]
MCPTIFHIDVNSAYLSWTAIEYLKKGADEDLRDIPCIIGGDRESRHGVVLAKSIPAKRFGIRTGEPVVNALKKCPDLRMERPDHKLYARYSRQMMNLLKDYTPDIEQLSIDECFLDFTGIAYRFSDPIEGAFDIKNRIRDELGFTVNIGISTNKLLAKMASDFEKPDRVHTLFPKEMPEKMWPLPVSELYMAGRSSVEVLRKLEIRTIGELAKADPNFLSLHLKSHGRTLWEFANGIGDDIVRSEAEEAKGIGNSITLSRDAETAEEARKVLLSLSESVGRRLRKAQKKAGMVSVEIRYANFRNVSHQAILDTPSQADSVIYKAACRLFGELWSGEPIRLLGIRTAKLHEEDVPLQMNLFDYMEEKKKDEKHQKLDQALDEIKKKFGDDAVFRGTLMDGK